MLFNARLVKGADLALPAQPLPNEENLKLEDLLSREDPNKLYTNQKKIGEGFDF